ncbi:high mobility group B protein 6-like [Camellia sinensis]|uniref:high mobility group B protein 6-like n=1 Tax=Camellia sinensis TaxID=4442 RepID=UPI001035AEF4|nr:high mobility group B protein 6-like [Camellia sinensis]
MQKSNLNSTNREKELEKKDKKKKGFTQIIWLKDQWSKSKKEKDQQPMSPFLAFATEAMRLLEEEQHLQLQNREAVGGRATSSVAKVNSNREKELENKDKKKKGFHQIIWLKDQWRKSKKEKDQQPMSPFLAFTIEAVRLLEEEQQLQLQKNWAYLYLLRKCWENEGALERNREKELEKKDKKKKGFSQVIWLKDLWRKSKKEKDQQPMSPFLAFTTEAMRLLEEEQQLQLQKNWAYLSLLRKYRENERALGRNREKVLENKDKKKKGFPQIIWLKDQWRKSKKEKDQQPMSPFLAFTTEAMRLLEEEQHLQLQKNWAYLSLLRKYRENEGALERNREKELEKKDTKKKAFPQIIWLKDQWRKSMKEKDQQPMSPFLAFTTEAMRLLEKEKHLQLQKFKVEPQLLNYDSYRENREKELEMKDKKKKGFPQIIWLKDQWRKSKEEKDQQPMSPFLVFITEAMRLLVDE